MADDAIYGLSVVPLSRSKAGGSPIAKMAYRRGAVERDNAGVLHDYSRKGRNTVREFWQMVPPDAPAWAHEAGEMWRRVDRVEKRRDARFARDFQITLPRELNHTQQKAALEQFCAGLLRQGMVGTAAIHDYGEAVGKGKSPEAWGETNSLIETGKLPSFRRAEILAMKAAHDPRLEADHAVIERGGALRRYQPHAHIMVSERRLDFDGPEGFSRTKDRTWNDKSRLIGWREQWEQIENSVLEAAGSDLRADCRSRNARGLEGAAEPKLGHCPSTRRQEEFRAARETRRLYYERRQLDRAIATIEKGMQSGPGYTMAEKSPQAPAERFVPQWALKSVFGPAPCPWARCDGDGQVIFKIGSDKADKRRIYDRGDHLTTNHLDRDTAAALVKLARAKGWRRVDLTGTQAQQIALAQALAAEGIAIGKCESEAVRQVWHAARNQVAAGEKAARILALERELSWLKARRQAIEPEKRAAALEIVRDQAVCPRGAPTIHQLRRRRDDLEKAWHSAQSANTALAEAEGRSALWRITHQGQIKELRQQSAEADAAWQKAEPAWQGAETAVLAREKLITASKVKIDDRIGDVTDTLAELVPGQYESRADVAERQKAAEVEKTEKQKALVAQIEKIQRADHEVRRAALRREKITEAQAGQQKPRYSAEVAKLMQGPSPFG
ncbi:MAG: MobA/MobL family protein [Clostridia bacterium]|nr:MobA/MobL family protein [Clostridia bacterium]